MGIKALSKVIDAWYTPESERTEEDDDEITSNPNPTRFKLRPLTPPQLESVMQSQPGVGIVVPISRYSEVLKMGLIDWENFTEENGKELKPNFTNHHLIPQKIRMELGSEIIDISQIDEEDSKN